jgi:transketolase
MTVMAPADPVEAGLAVRAAAEWPGPCYLRLGKSGDPVVHASPPSFEIGKAIRVRDGSDLTLVATGSMVKVALEAANLLSASGVEALVLSMHTVRPIDTVALRVAAASTELIATVEEHSAIGGLRGAVLEALSDVPIAFVSFALPSDHSLASGPCARMLERAGLTAPGIASAVAVELGRRRGALS